MAEDILMNTRKLLQAEAAVKQGKWLEYVQIGHPGIVLQIDNRLLPKIGQFLEDGEFGVGAELARHYLQAVQHHGLPTENPACIELFLTFGDNPPVTVYLCTINGAIYFNAEPMMPF